MNVERLSYLRPAASAAAGLSNNQSLPLFLALFGAHGRWRASGCHLTCFHHDNDKPLSQLQLQLWLHSAVGTFSAPFSDLNPHLRAMTRQKKLQKSTKIKIEGTKFKNSHPFDSFRVDKTWAGSSAELTQSRGV